MFLDSFTEYEGWFLTALSSLMCIIGASIIYLDLIIRKIYPNSTFDIKSNEKFLIMGFSLSCGSLLYTSLYKLLPKATKYFDMNSEEGSIPASLKVMLFFSAGVVLCFSLNYIIHHFASQSIVHCNHGGDEESQLATDQGHSHSHSHSHSSGTEESEDLENHLENHSHKHTHDTAAFKHSHSNLHSSFDNKHAHSHSPLNSSNESTPLLGRPQLLSKKNSSFFTFFNSLTDSNKCVCLSEENCQGHPCISKQFTDKISNDIQNLEFYRDMRDNSKSLVAYTIDEPENNHGLPKEDLFTSQQLRISNEPDLHLHHYHKDDHQHQINTPLSRILSLGFQTSIALTLHKFPEGFITYATSKADPKAGIAIFLSLGIHNIMEGFSMVLPLYLALNSRLKAFSITFVLGGFSQPLGALMAYYLLEGKELDTDETNFIFGILIAVTCGFLTIISLQLFASAINFGGSANKVIGWSIIGIFIIQLSTVLTDYSSFEGRN